MESVAALTVRLGAATQGAKHEERGWICKDTIQNLDKNEDISDHSDLKTANIFRRFFSEFDFRNLTASYQTHLHVTTRHWGFTRLHFETKVN
jgi:hypothetical protein